MQKEKKNIAKENLVIFQSPWQQGWRIQTVGSTGITWAATGLTSLWLTPPWRAASSHLLVLSFSFFASFPHSGPQLEVFIFITRKSQNTEYYQDRVQWKRKVIMYNAQYIRCILKNTDTRTHTDICTCMYTGRTCLVESSYLRELEDENSHFVGERKIRFPRQSGVLESILETWKRSSGKINLQND